MKKDKDKEEKQCSISEKENKDTKKCRKKLTSKRGSELVQTVLITAIMIVIVATMFYPGIEGVFSNSIGRLQTWYDGVMTKMAPTAYM